MQHLKLVRDRGTKGRAWPSVKSSPLTDFLYTRLCMSMFSLPIVSILLRADLSLSVVWPGGQSPLTVTPGSLGGVPSAEVFGHKYELYQTKQTFIVELGFLGVHSDEDQQR